MRPVAARGGDRARQPGAARLGHHPLGQRLRGVGPSALPRAGEGALDPGRRVFRKNINQIYPSGGKYPQHEVQGLLRAGAHR